MPQLNAIGLVVHGGKPVALEAADVLRTWAHDHGLKVIDIDVWSSSWGANGRALSEVGGPDLIVTIGGDGTFLRGVAAAEVADVPVLGVNVGRVGFLTEVAPSQMTEAIEAFRTDAAIIEPRLTLTVRSSRMLEIPPGLDALLAFGRGPALPPPTLRASSPDDVGWGVPVDVTALNDVVFEKLSRDRQASLGVYIGSRHFVSYSADALVVASPTGSTAYSFAAGGPIVSPRARAIIFTPVAAHMVFDRSLVLADDELITIRVMEKSGGVALSVDGQIKGVLEPGDWVGVYAREWQAQLVRLTAPDFFGRIRDRFGLADAAAAVADGSLPSTYVPSGHVPDDLRHVNIPTVEPDDAGLRP